MRRARGERSQAWLALKTDCDQTTISRIERGIYRLGPELMVALAVALDVELEDLFSFPPGLISRARFERELKEAHREKAAAGATS